MARKLREIIVGATYHIYSRCIDRMNLLANDYIKDLLVTVIRETQEKYCFELCSVDILDNHIHLIIKTTSKKDTISLIMQRIKSVFAKRYNKMNSRTGPFWNERFGSKIVEKAKDAARYIIHLLWYTAYNSVRKGKTRDPRHYKYSTINAYLDEDYIGLLKITLHRGFLNLGKNFSECKKYFTDYEKEYRESLHLKI